MDEKIRMPIKRSKTIFKSSKMMILRWQWIWKYKWGYGNLPSVLIVFFLYGTMSFGHWQSLDLPEKASYDTSLKHVQLCDHPKWFHGHLWFHVSEILRTANSFVTILSVVSVCGVIWSLLTFDVDLSLCSLNLRNYAFIFVFSRCFVAGFFFPTFVCFLW